MEKNEEEKPKGYSEDDPESLGFVSQECTLPDMKKMSPEEMKSYLDDLLLSHIFSKG